MPKATIVANASPSEELIAKAQSTSTIKDARGRTITLKKPGVLSQFHLVEALGDAAQNQVYMGMVFPLLYVASIDGVTEKPVRTKLQVEALIQRLDEEGIEAVVEGVRQTYGTATPDADKEALKNS